MSSGDRTYTNPIYCSTDDVIRASGIDPSDVSTSDITEFILDAEAEVDEWTGKYFTPVTFTEYHTGRPVETSATDNINEGVYFDVPREASREILLEHYPIISVTSVELLSDDGSVESTLTESTGGTDGDYHIFYDIGKIWIFTEKIPAGMHKKMVKVIYQAGTSTVPRKIKRLTEVIAAIKLLVQQAGGTYNDVTSYSLPEGISVAKGEPWVNIIRTLERLEKERDNLLNMIGREVRTVVV